MRQTAKEYPDKIAIYYEDEKIAYSQLDQDVDNLAQALLNSGLEPQGRVGIVLGNDANFIRSYFAVLRAGGVAVLLNPASKGEELKYFIEDSGIKHIITSMDTLPVITGILDQVPPIKQLIVAGGTKDELITPLEDILSQKASPVEVNVSEGDIDLLVHLRNNRQTQRGFINPPQF